MSKHNIKSVVEITEEDTQLKLDDEFTKELSKQTEEFNKKSDFDNKCINICADLRNYLDNNYIGDKVFTSLSVDNIIQLLGEIYS